MKKTREDNTVAIIQKAVRYFNIPVMKSTVKEVLKSHPGYPNLKSICDTLNEWNIENYPLKYRTDEIMELKAPYIVHFKDGGGKIGFVSRIENDNITFYDSYRTKIKITSNEFLHRCSGAIIVLNPDKKSGELDYSKKWQNEMISKAILPVSFFSLLLYIIYSFVVYWSPSEAIGDKMSLFLTKIVGMIFSLLLILYEFEVHTSLTDKLCHLNKATNCNIILNDKASKIFGWFGWSDVGIIYFTAGFVFLLQNQGKVGCSFLAILSILSLPYPVYSVYYQGFIFKKWCPLCLGVQAVLIIEFIILIPMLSNLIFSLKGLLYLILSFLLTGIVYCLLEMNFKEKKISKAYYNKYLSFKKNPEAFKTLLLQKKHYKIPINYQSIVFGQRDSDVMVTAFLSLQCSHCARAFERIREILRLNKRIAINIVLVTADNTMLSALYYLNHKDNGEEALELLDQWYSMNSFSRNKLSEGSCYPELDELAEGISIENQRLYKECNVKGTPTFFINGYQFPAQYEIDDIKYMTEVIKNIENVKV